MQAGNLFRTNFIFILAIFILFFLVFLTYRSAQEVTEGRTLEARTYKILDKLERLLTQAIDVETGSRGYALTGKEEFLGPMESSKVALELTMDSLRNLIMNDEQDRRLDTLDQLLKEKLAISETIVTMRREQGMEFAVAYVSKGDGRRAMDSIRHVLRRAVNNELAALSEHAAATNKKRQVRGIYFSILIMVALLVIVIAYAVNRISMNKLLENKKIQEDLIDELAYQNKQLDQFAHITSHNLRGPANNINSLLGMLTKDSPLSEFQFIFDKIGKVSKNLMDTLNELLEILHLKRSRSTERTTLHFQQVFMKEKENLEGEILKSQAEIYFDFSAAPTVEYSKTYLQSICHNLMSNALKYRSDDRIPMIHVNTEMKDGRVLLHVSDNGQGMDLNVVGDKLFGLRKTFHDHPDARGIGLFMTKTQIESLGGKIQVESKPGVGTTFTVLF